MDDVVFWLAVLTMSVAMLIPSLREKIIFCVMRLIIPSLSWVWLAARVLMKKKNKIGGEASSSPNKSPSKAKKPIVTIKTIRDNSVWMPDNLAKTCCSCDAAFTTFRRRHHCRFCKKIFCKKCSSRKYNAERICDKCYVVAMRPAPLAFGVADEGKRSETYLHAAEEALDAFEEILGEGDDAWELMFEKNDVAAYKYKVEEEPYTFVKGVGVINEPLQRIVDIVVDLTRKKEYDSMFDSGHVVEQITDTGAVTYHGFKKPNFIVAARDFCMASSRRELSDGSLLLASTSVTHDGCPEVSGNVRARLALGGFKLTPINDQQTHVLYLSKVDLCGSIPGAVLSMVAKKQPMSVAKIREALKKSRKQ